VGKTKTDKWGEKGKQEAQCRRALHDHKRRVVFRHWEICFLEKEVYMRVVLVVPAMLVALATPAWASQCPSRIAALDELISQHGSMLNPEKMAQVNELRDKAEQAHAAGNHDESVNSVQRAQDLIGM
jgi:hypothetical protein